MPPSPLSTVLARRGLSLHIQPGMVRELDLLLHELFDTQPYTRHGVVLADGMCVVDLGANLGLFSLWCTTQARDLDIVACEPVPPLARLAEQNTRQAPSGQVRVLACGIGADAGRQTVRFYPRATACSSVYGDATEAQMPTLYADVDLPLEALWSIHKGAWLLGRLSGPAYPWVRRQVIRRVLSHALATHHDHDCDFVPLSQVLDEQQLERVDLLKVDVQGSESSVFDGLRDDQWPRIQSIAMEVNRFLGPPEAEDLQERLEARGFRVTRDDSDEVAAPGSHFLYAVRP